MTRKTNLLNQAYDLLNDEEDARVCKDIRDSACRYTPANYFLILISNMLTKLGDTLSNPKTVLTWVMSYVQAPVALISFIVPIRESGSMLPQIIIAHYIRKREIRKWVWVIGSTLQFLSIGSIGLVALSFTGFIAGWLMVGLLVVFSLSRGLCSVASKDVLGKTIPKTRRGKLKGYTVSVSGALVLAAGLYMVVRTQQDAGIGFYSGILFVAAVTWLIAAILFANVKEFPGETDGGGNGWKEAFAKIHIVRTDQTFRRFIIARSLLLSSALTAPFYVLLAQRNLGDQAYLLGLFIIARGVASIISAPVWGRWADRASHRVMATGGLLTALLGIAVWGVLFAKPDLKDASWLYPAAFFVLGIAHNGVRLGRKTYVLDIAGGNKRTDYVSVSNTLIGAILLLTGGISALASTISVTGIILVLSVIGLGGALASFRLPNVEQ